MKSKVNKENNMNKPIRHGEAMLVPITKAVRGKQHTQYIIAHSETGHHHVLESKVPFVVSETDKQFVIELFEPAQIVHKKQLDKHKTLPVASGKYKVVKKTEYDPWQEIIREVHD